MAEQLLPCVTKNSKGEWVQLICNEYSTSRQVYCDKYRSVGTGKAVQGFVNHMRTLHGIHLPNHVEAADRFGVLLELNDAEKQNYEENRCKSKKEKQAVMHDRVQSARQLRDRGSQRSASSVAADEPCLKRKRKSVARSPKTTGGDNTASHYPAEPAEAPMPLSSTRNAESSTRNQSTVRNNDATTTRLPSLDRLLKRRGNTVPLQTMIDEHEQSNRVMRRYLANQNAPDFIIPGVGPRAVVTSTGHVRPPAPLSIDRDTESATRPEGLRALHRNGNAPTDPLTGPLAQRRPLSAHNGKRRQDPCPAASSPGLSTTRMPETAINNHQTPGMPQHQPSSLYDGYSHRPPYLQANLQVGLAVQMHRFPPHSLHPDSLAINALQYGSPTANSGYHHFTQDQLGTSQAERMLHGTVNGVLYRPPPASQYGGSAVYGGDHDQSQNLHARSRFVPTARPPPNPGQGVSIMETITDPGAFMQSLSESAAQSNNGAVNRHSTVDTNMAMPTSPVPLQQSSSGQGAGQMDFGFSNGALGEFPDFDGFPAPMEPNAEQTDDTQVQEQWAGMSGEFDADAFVDFENEHPFVAAPFAGPNEEEMDNAAPEQLE